MFEKKSVRCCLLSAVARHGEQAMTGAFSMHAPRPAGGRCPRTKEMTGTLSRDHADPGHSPRSSRRARTARSPSIPTITSVFRNHIKRWFDKFSMRHVKIELSFASLLNLASFRVWPSLSLTNLASLVSLANVGERGYHLQKHVLSFSATVVAILSFFQIAYHVLH